MKFNLAFISALCLLMVTSCQSFIDSGLKIKEFSIDFEGDSQVLQYSELDKEPNEFKNASPEDRVRLVEEETKNFLNSTATKSVSVPGSLEITLKTGGSVMLKIETEKMVSRVKVKWVDKSAPGYPIFLDKNMLFLEPNTLLGYEVLYLH